MSEPTHRSDEQALIRRLRDEARDDRPAFSEALHERICRAIGDRRMGETPLATARPARRRNAYWLRILVAAACAVAVAVVAWQAMVSHDLPRPGGGDKPPIALEQPRTPVAPQSASVAASDPVSDLADEAIDQLGTMVDSAVTIQQWAYLDHDARLAAEMVTDHLPSMQLAQEP